MLLSSCITKYLEYCYALAKGTRLLYLGHLNRLVDEEGDLPIDEVTTDVLCGFMANLRQQDGEEYSRSYQSQVFRTLNSFFEWCVRKGTLKTNPMGGVLKPIVPKRKSPRLTLKEVKRLLKAVRKTAHPKRNLAIVYLMLDSGLRRGEVLKLSLADVDTKARIVRVFDEKTQEDRDVPLGPETCKALKAYLKVRQSTTTNALFVTSEGTALTKNALQSLMRRLKEEAGLPRLYCHLLRHTFANHYISGGGNLRKLQKILGHNDVTTTARIYLDPELKELKDEHSRVSPLAQMRKRKSGK